MIIDSKLKERIMNIIIEVCRKEVYNNKSKELLGLTFQYFYDEKVIDIGCAVHIFDNNIDEGYAINISFTSEDIIDIELINIVEKVAYDERHKIIKQISEELKDAAKSIAWSLVVNTYEDMFIELEEYN